MFTIAVKKIDRYLNYKQLWILFEVNSFVYLYWFVILINICMFFYICYFNYFYYYLLLITEMYYHHLFIIN